MNPDLLLLLQYENMPVVSHFCHHHPEFSITESKVLFKDLLAWMWLSRQRSAQGKKTYLFGPLRPMDELWHTFILHTRDYTHFSITYFGDYFHHEVEPPGFEHTVEDDELTDFLQDCFTYLGSNWVERQFSAAFTEII